MRHGNDDSAGMSGIDGARVRARRQGLGMTQAQLSERSGLSQEAISRVENGKIKGLLAPTQEALARALGVSVSWLMGAGDGGAEHLEGALGYVPRDPEVVREENDPLVIALGDAFDPKRHLVVDTHAVLRALRATDRRLVEGADLVGAARRWLDAAAGLRREGIMVTSENVLVRATLGRTARAGELATEREADANAEADAKLRARGIEPGAPKVQLPRRKRG